jgi:hypothetical protein
MNYLKHAIVLAILLPASEFTTLLAGDAPSSPEQLQSQLNSALKAKDVDGIRALFNPKSETNATSESSAMKEMMISRQTRILLEAPSPTVKLAPLSSDFSASQTNEQNGICTSFDVPVTGLVEVEGDGGYVQHLPYGKQGTGYYLAAITQAQIPGRFLTVNILAGPNSDLLTFTGRWVYARGGEDVAVNISDKTNRFVVRWGDYIKLCEIRRTSTNQVAGFDNWFYFDIVEGGAHVFESPGLTNEDLFVYRKK